MTDTRSYDNCYDLSSLIFSNLVATSLSTLCLCPPQKKKMQKCLIATKVFLSRKAGLGQVFFWKQDIYWGSCDV